MSGVQESAAATTCRAWPQGDVVDDADADEGIGCSRVTTRTFSWPMCWPINHTSSPIYSSSCSTHWTPARGGVEHTHAPTATAAFVGRGRVPAEENSVRRMRAKHTFGFCDAKQVSVARDQPVGPVSRTCVHRRHRARGERSGSRRVNRVCRMLVRASRNTNSCKPRRAQKKDHGSEYRRARGGVRDDLLSTFGGAGIGLNAQNQGNQRIAYHVVNLRHDAETRRVGPRRPQEHPSIKAYRI